MPDFKWEDLKGEKVLAVVRAEVTGMVFEYDTEEKRQWIAKGFDHRPEY